MNLNKLNWPVNDKLLKLNYSFYSWMLMQTYSFWNETVWAGVIMIFCWNWPEKTYTKQWSYFVLSVMVDNVLLEKNKNKKQDGFPHECRVLLFVCLFVILFFPQTFDFTMQSWYTILSPLMYTYNETNLYSVRNVPIMGKATKRQ